MQEFIRSCNFSIMQISCNFVHKGACYRPLNLNKGVDNSAIVGVLLPCYLCFMYQFQELIIWGSPSLLFVFYGSIPGTHYLFFGR